MSRLSLSICVFVTFALAIGCEPSDKTSLEATLTDFNSAGAPTVQFSVPDMMCPESCAVQTKEILSKQPGAKEVIVDFESKTATVAIEEGTFDADAAIAALVDHGFDHSQLKSAAVESPASEAATEPAPQPAG